MKGITTKVGKYTIPVRNAHHLTICSFGAGARGKKERGDYAFWTAVLSKRFVKGKGKESTSISQIFGRSHLLLSPGDRFDRMKREMRIARTKDDRAIYRMFWNDVLKKGGNIKYIRPCTLQEMNRWLETHEKDSVSLNIALIDGMSLDIIGEC